MRHQPHQFARPCIVRLAGLASMIVLAGCVKSAGVDSHGNPIYSPDTVTLSISSPALIAGQPLTLRASVSPSNATGTIAFTDTLAGEFASMLLQNGSASATVALTVLGQPVLVSGTHQLVAAYTGDATYASTGSNVIPLLVSSPGANCGLGAAAYAFNSGVSSLSGLQSTGASADDAVCAANSGTLVTINAASIVFGAGYPYNDPSGIGSAVLAYGPSATTASGPTLNLTNSSVSATGVASPAVTAAGLGSQVNVSQSQLSSRTNTATNANGQQIALGYVVIAERSGSVTLTGGSAAAGDNTPATLFANGTGSSITVNGSKLTSEAAAARIVGGAVVTLTNPSISSVENVLIFVADSSSAAAAAGSLQLTGGSITYASDIVSNVILVASGQTANVSMSGTQITSVGTYSQNFMVVGISATANLSMSAESFSGSISTQDASVVNLSLTQASRWQGDFPVAVGTHNLTIDAGSVWSVTSDSTLNILNDSSGISGGTITNIIGNGHTVKYTAAQNPALKGATYTLAGGGSLVPA